MKPMMKCGHAANAVRTGTNEPICVICIGIHPGADQVDDNPPNLTGRKACCAYGKHAIVDSTPNLAFFEHKPDKEMDEYYCGCHGWD